MSFGPYAVRGIWRGGDSVILYLLPVGVNRFVRGGKCHSFFLDSSDKCNKMVVRDLVGCSEAEALTRTVIKTLVDESDVVV